MEYSELSALYDTLAQTSLRLKKTYILAGFLKRCPEKDLDSIMLLLQGRVFPQWDKQVLGVSEKIVVKAIALCSGTTEKAVLDRWRQVGDIGAVAVQLLTKRTQSTLTSESLTVKGVVTLLRKIACTEGAGSTEHKTKLITQMLSSAQGTEATYIVRTILGDLRIGIAQGTLRDAVLYAFLVDQCTYDEERNIIMPEGSTLKEELTAIQGALDKSNDMGKVAACAKEKGLAGLQAITIEVGKPLKCMLAQKAADLHEGFERVGVPCMLEYKLDGFRLQCHKQHNGTITLFTRRLEDVTAQFPDVVAALSRMKGKEFILDTEAVGYDPLTKKYRPFQDISQRIRRKYDIATIKNKLPVELNVFDLLYLEGEDLLEMPYSARRQKLAGLTPHQPLSLQLTTSLITSEHQEAERFYKESLSAGNEGIILKKLDAPYQPGSRVGAMIKLKPVLDTFDLAIIAAEWGTGKRSGWLTSFTLGVYDEQTDEVLAIGKFGTGIKEKESEGVSFEEMTARLTPLIKRTTGRDVELSGDLIVEVQFEEIQKSPTYSSGYALRFPRFVGLRDDRGVQDMTTLEIVRRAYEKQRGGR